MTLLKVITELFRYGLGVEFHTIDLPGLDGKPNLYMQVFVRCPQRGLVNSLCWCLDEPSPDQEARLVADLQDWLGRIGMSNRAISGL